MADPDLERRRKRAVELGNAGRSDGWSELVELFGDSAPAVRRAAASALGKLLDHNESLAPLVAVPLAVALTKEEAPQVLHYALKALLKCAGFLNQIVVDDLMDLARDPTRKDYVRNAANEVIAEVERRRKASAARKAHWCSRCRRIVSEEESRLAIEKYGRPYCRHCLEEKVLEDANFNAAVEEAKRLRTVDEVAVQSQGEKRIGDWLAKRGIAYEYDERFLIAKDTRIRPDFYLPEFDLYIEYWGMDTPEYVANMRRKRILYQQARRRLISIGWQDLDRIEQVLAEKLSRYIAL